MCRTLDTREHTRELRHALGRFATGVAVVTGRDRNGDPVGMTINSFTSISMVPPLVAWCIDCTAASYGAFAAADRFTVTVLAEDQHDLANRFATRGADKFDGLPVENDRVPRIPGGCAWFECRTQRTLLLGDHLMLVGEVLTFEGSERSPLVFAGGGFHQLAEPAVDPSRVAA